MTLPSEEIRALKQTREFMRKILTMRVTDFRKMSRDQFEEWRQGAYSCLKHYPFDLHIDERWADDVCEHGADRRWCKECKETK